MTRQPDKLVTFVTLSQTRWVPQSLVVGERILWLFMSKTKTFECFDGRRPSQPVQTGQRSSTLVRFKELEKGSLRPVSVQRGKLGFLLLRLEMTLFRLFTLESVFAFYTKILKEEPFRVSKNKNLICRKPFCYVEWLGGMTGMAGGGIMPSIGGLIIIIGLGGMPGIGGIPAMPGGMGGMPGIGGGIIIGGGPVIGGMPGMGAMPGMGGGNLGKLPLLPVLNAAAFGRKKN
jgi:hypothetical protein